MPGTKKIKSDYPDIMIDIIGSHFLEVARQLREVLDESPEDFPFILQQLNHCVCTVLILRRQPQRKHRSTQRIAINCTDIVLSPRH